MNLKDMKLDESIVVNELKEYLKHQQIYKKSNMFINVLDTISMYSAYCVALFIIFIAIFSKNYSSQHAIIEGIDSLSVFDFIFIGFILNIAITLFTILTRELFIIFMKSIYREDFSDYINISDIDMDNVIKKLKKINPLAEKEVATVLNTVRYKNSGIHQLFTSGISKKIIFSLITIEMRSKITNYRNNEKLN